MQQVMNLCWKQNPISRPEILQILKWCDLPEFQSLRAVSPLETGKIYAVCQCTVNRTHSHTLLSNPPSNAKFTLQSYKEFDQLFTIPEITLHTPPISLKFDFKKSKYHTQVWIVQEVDKNGMQLQILTYRSTQVGYRVSVCAI